MNEQDAVSISLYESTDGEYGLHAILINTKSFPAKLWQLVNDPWVCSVRWDWFGFGIFIDQGQFEAEMLSPIGGTFKSSRFSSFHRQLNLYGFRKVMPMPSHVGVLHHHFFSPDFRQGRPDLLVNLKRLTGTNKARIQAGLELPRRLPSSWRCRKNRTEGTNVTAGYRLVGRTQQGTQMGAMPPHQPPQSEEHLLMGYDCIPNHLLPAQYCPACFAPAISDGFFQSPLTTDPTGCVPQSTPLPCYYYQTNYLPGHLHLYNQDQQSNENETVNLDMVSQIVSELQASPKLCMVKMETPENLIQLTCPSEVLQFPNSNLPASGQLSPQKCLSLSTSPLVMDSAYLSPSDSSPLVGIKATLPVSIKADAATGVPSLPGAN